MSLKPNLKLRAESSEAILTVRQKLGEGGQGAVFSVEGPAGEQVVKWYNGEQATEDQRTALRSLISHGAPKRRAGRRFVWPLDVVSATGATHFGYLMEKIDTTKFAELGQVQARLRKAPTFGVMCDVSYQVANSYRALHLEGLCYRDISTGNLMFNPETGEVRICDNDNVGVNKQSKCQVWGTMEYMAPEVVLGMADPSIETDLHSLAVLLFQFWTWHHPFHGQMEYDIRCWDLPAKRRLYGEQPVFIFHPDNDRNRLPRDPAYRTPNTRWGYCPPSLQQLFIRAFTTGATAPVQRVTEGEWQGLFQQLKDCVVPCPRDRAENFWDSAVPVLKCWHCGNPMPVPPKLKLSGPAGFHWFLLTRGAKLHERHVNPHVDEASADNVVGEVVQNPNDPKLWGLRNLTVMPWTATMPDGSTREVPSQRAAPIANGVKVQFSRTTGEMVG